MEQSDSAYHKRLTYKCRYLTFDIAEGHLKFSCTFVGHKLEIGSIQCYDLCVVLIVLCLTAAQVWQFLDIIGYNGARAAVTHTPALSGNTSIR